MVVVDLAEIGLLEEKIDSITARNSVAFKISKPLREKSFTMAIDIIIESIDYNLYESSKSMPATQFYGYCVLVFQDMTSLEIPIHFPRQRLYYAVQNEAFRQWRGYSDFYQEYFLHRQHDISIGLILAALEIPPVEIEYQVAETRWIELPLREVYLKFAKNTQFKVEFTRWQPIPFTDPISGKEIDGKSNQIDGDKENGLPKDGIQPKKNNPNAPFAFNNPTTSMQEAGQNGLPFADTDELSSVDPNNESIPDDYGYFAEITYKAIFASAPSNCVPYSRTVYYLIPSGSTGINDVVDSLQVHCGSDTYRHTLYAIPSNQRIDEWQVLSISSKIIRSADNPPDRSN